MCRKGKRKGEDTVFSFVPLSGSRDPLQVGPLFHPGLYREEHLLTIARFETRAFDNRAKLTIL